MRCPHCTQYMVWAGPAAGVEGLLVTITDVTIVHHLSEHLLPCQHHTVQNCCEDEIMCAMLLEDPMCT